jgi:hypothetical protein
MLEAVSTYETSVNLNVTTRRYIPENSKIITRRRENLKSHTTQMFTGLCITLLPLMYRKF